jgi:hypothetical protein
MASGRRGVLSREVPGRLNRVRLGTGLVAGAELFSLAELDRASLDKI